VVFRTCPDWI